MQIDIDNKLYKEIENYCAVNSLKIEDLINKFLKRAFTIEKYGETPFSNEAKNENSNAVTIKKEKYIPPLLIIKDNIENKEKVVTKTRKRKLN